MRHVASILGRNGNGSSVFLVSPLALRVSVSLSVSSYSVCCMLRVYAFESRYMRSNRRCPKRKVLRRISPEQGQALLALHTACRRQPIAVKTLKWRGKKSEAMLEEAAQRPSGSGGKLGKVNRNQGPEIITPVHPANPIFDNNGQNEIYESPLHDAGSHERVSTDCRPGYAERVRPSAIWTAFDREQSSRAPKSSVHRYPFPERGAGQEPERRWRCRALVARPNAGRPIRPALSRAARSSRGRPRGSGRSRG